MRNSTSESDEYSDDRLRKCKERMDLAADLEEVEGGEEGEEEGEEEGKEELPTVA